MILTRISRLIFVLLIACASLYGQEVPKGVRYKPAPDAINNASKASLEAALASDSFPLNLFGDVTAVGPMLWKSLKPSADQVLLSTKPIIHVIPGPKPFQAEGKSILTDDQRKAFWKSIRDKYPALKDGKVRKGNAKEISYFWATIPFDIEEPFWVIDTGTDQFIANFQVKDGQARLFWIDRVGDLQTLSQ